jgi:hypothetical protein
MENVQHEFWLVFRYEGDYVKIMNWLFIYWRKILGKSLDRLLYQPIPSIGGVIWQPSSFWLRMRNNHENGW